MCRGSSEQKGDGSLQRVGYSLQGAELCGDESSRALQVGGTWNML